MEHNNRNYYIKGMILKILILTIATTVLIALYLVYKGSFTNVEYSNSLFYAAMAYIAVGGLVIGGSHMSVNSFAYKYSSTVMSTDYETRKKIDDALTSNGIRFSIQMIAIGLLLILTAAAADKLIQ